MSKRDFEMTARAELLPFDEITHEQSQPVQAEHNMEPARKRYN